MTKGLHNVGVNGKSKVQEACFLCYRLCEKKTNCTSHISVYLPVRTERVRGACVAGGERRVPPLTRGHCVSGGAFTRWGFEHFRILNHGNPLPIQKQIKLKADGSKEHRGDRRQHCPFCPAQPPWPPEVPQRLPSVPASGSPGSRRGASEEAGHLPQGPGARGYFLGLSPVTIAAERLKETHSHWGSFHKACYVMNCVPPPNPMNILKT